MWIGHRWNWTVIVATVVACGGEGATASGGTTEASSSSSNEMTGDTTEATTSSDDTAEATTSSDDTAEATTSSDDTADTGGPPVCGDGVVDPPEVCDDGVNDGGYGGCIADCSARGPHCGDGEQQRNETCEDDNEIDSDGCNANCEPSATLLWRYAVPRDGTEYFGDLAVDEDQVVVSAGLGPSDSRYASALRFAAADGTLLEEWTSDQTSTAYVAAHAVAIDARGGFWLAGLHDEEFGTGDYGHSWIRNVFAEPLVEHESGVNLDYYEMELDPSDGALVVFGRRYFAGCDVQGFVAKVDTTGALVWNTELPCGWPMSLAVDADGTAFAMLRVDPFDMVVQLVDTDGVLGAMRPIAISQSTGDVALAPDQGLVALTSDINATVDPSAQLQRFDPDGALVWSQQLADDSALITMRQVAVGPVGSPVVGGHLDDATMVLRRYFEDGTLAWEVLEDTGYGRVWAIEIGPDNSVYVTAHGETEMFVEKYSP